MTTENKLLIGAGSFLALIGGFIWYKKSQENKDLPSSDNAFLDQNENNIAPIIPKSATAPIRATPTKTTPAIPKGFSYRVGQKVMASLRDGVAVYDVNKDANGDYFSKKINIKRFNYGQEIGDIIYVGKMPDNTYRYVVKSPTGLNRELYWVNHTDIKPVGAVIPPKSTIRKVTKVDFEKLLYRGVQNSSEVAELQKRLNILADGDFGQNTQNALLAIKGVKQIRLKDF